MTCVAVKIDTHGLRAVWSGKVHDLPGGKKERECSFQLTADRCPPFPTLLWEREGQHFPKLLLLIGFPLFFPSLFLPELPAGGKKNYPRGNEGCSWVQDKRRNNSNNSDINEKNNDYDNDNNDNNDGDNDNNDNNDGDNDNDNEGDNNDNDDGDNDDGDNDYDNDNNNDNDDGDNDYDNDNNDNDDGDNDNDDSDNDNNDNDDSDNDNNDNDVSDGDKDDSVNNDNNIDNNKPFLAPAQPSRVVCKMEAQLERAHIAYTCFARFGADLRAQSGAW